MGLSPRQPENLFSDQLELSAFSRGMGALGLPGDLSSASRFVRAAFVGPIPSPARAKPTRVGSSSTSSARSSSRRAAARSAPANLSGPSTPPAGTHSAASITTTYGCRQIHAVDMHRENLDSISRALSHANR